MTQITEKISFPFRGVNCCAAGIIPYDDDGMWLVIEEGTKGNKLFLTDMGSRCQKSDGSILRTAVRSFNEESLFIDRLDPFEFRKQFHDRKIPSFYIGSGKDSPKSCYASFWIPIDHKGPQKNLAMKLSKEKFQEARKNEVMKNGFESRLKDLVYVRFDEIKNFSKGSDIEVSWRLKNILRSAVRYGII